MEEFRSFLLLFGDFLPYFLYMFMLTMPIAVAKIITYFKDAINQNFNNLLVRVEFFLNAEKSVC